MSDHARFRKGFLLGLVIAITAAFFFVIKDFLMTIFVAAIFSGLAHPLYAALRNGFGGREAPASAFTLLIIVLLVGAPLVFVAVGLDSDRIHAPNEKAEKALLLKGAEAAAYLWPELAAPDGR